MWTKRSQSCITKNIFFGSELAKAGNGDIGGRRDCVTLTDVPPFFGVARGIFMKLQDVGRKAPGLDSSLVQRQKKSSSRKEVWYFLQRAIPYLSKSLLVKWNYGSTTDFT